MTAAALQSSRRPKGTPGKCFGDFLPFPGICQKTNQVTKTAIELY
jgi:hypothetical protein